MTPEVLPPGYKYMPCRYCDEPMIVLTRRRSAPHHLECGIRVSMDNSRQIAMKQGPYYERWAAGVARYATTLPRGGGDTVHGG